MLEIAPYNINHVDRSYDFLIDTFHISFGHDKSCWPNNLGNYSFEKYRSDVEKCLSNEAFLLFGVHHNGQLVGQIELKILKDECGYVSFYYLVPEYRNKGLGKQLDDVAVSEFRRRGCKKIRLTVGEYNKKGLRFYERNGWAVVGTDPKLPMGLVMEKII